MSKPIGIRIGNYRIKPLGIAVLAALVVGIVLLVVKALGGPGADVVSDAAPAAANRSEPVQQVSSEVASDRVQPEDDGDAAQAPTPSPSPRPTPVPAMRTATIRALGEIAMESNLLFSAADGNEFDFAPMFSEIETIMGDADYTIADVEGTLGGVKNISGSKKLITPPALIQTLKDCGVDMLTLANDHALDGGIDELQAAIANCKAAGMDYIGVSASQEERDTPHLVDINGIQVAFVAYTESMSADLKGMDAATLSYSINLIHKKYASTPAKIKQDIDDARAAGADVIICCVSWGEMFNPKFTDSQKTIAKYLNSWGVDVIIGYNPHVVQPATWVESTDKEGNVHRTLVVGATGNFLSDQRKQYTDSGMVFEFTISETEYGHFAITGLKYIPTYVWRRESEDESSSKMQYRTLSAGQWLEEPPEGMAYSDAVRMREVWSEVQSVMGPTVASVAAE